MAVEASLFPVCKFTSIDVTRPPSIISVVKGRTTELSQLMVGIRMVISFVCACVDTWGMGWGRGETAFLKKLSH